MINRKALSLYLSYKHVPTPLSIIEGKGRKMADVRCPDFSTTCLLPEGKIVEKLNYLLTQTIVNMRDRWLVSEKPAILLSGGIDSGIVAVIASKLFGKGLRTFCITYDHESEGKSTDREYSKRIAELCGSKHSELMIKLDDFPNALIESSRIMGEPFSGYITPWFAGKMLAEHEVKTVLTGDWGDELFGSYKAHRLAAQMPGTPSWALRYETVVFNDNEKKLLCRGPVASALDHLKYEYFHSNLNAHDSVNRMLEAEFHSFYPDHTYLAFSALTKHFGVNAVSPYSDNQFADFAASIPGHLKVTPDGETKYIEKKLAERYLPKEIVHRPKEGFTTNTLKLCTDLEQWVKSTLRPEHLNRHWLFNVKYVESIISRFYNSPNDDDAYKVWNLVCFQVWYDRYFGYV